jgi:hypothetical protein
VTSNEERLVPDLLADRELMRLHLEALFTQDASGRLLRVNEPEGKVAPRVFLGRTAEGSEARFRHDLPDAIVRDLESLCANEPFGDEFLTPPYGVTAYAELLARDAPVERIWTGPAYRFPGMMSLPSRAVPVTGANAEVLSPHLEDWRDDVAIRQPMLAVLVEGRAVSLCCSVRIAAAHEAGVETAFGFRGRGYATQAVAAWAERVRSLGRIPLYSTSWQNHESQSVTRKLGLTRFGTDLHIT